MKKIGFIGAYDKTDLILYVAKILKEMNQRVLFIDATITQKARYVVPNIQPVKSYITEFEGIDVVIGMKSFEEIKEYLKLYPSEELPYDVILIDTNSAGGVLSYRISECEKIFFATSFDLYSIRRGLESISSISGQAQVTKVIFSKEASADENNYLNYLALGSNVQWEDTIIYFPFENGDQTIIHKNQRVSKLKIKNLSNQYKEGLIYLANEIAGQEKYGELKKAIRKIEKGV